MSGDLAMDGEEPSTSSPSGTPRKSLLRSATWTARSSSPSFARPTPNPDPANSTMNRPPKPGRLNIPPIRPISGWPHPGYDDWPPFRHPSTPSPAPTDDISLVAPHVYLGSDAAARDRSTLRRHGITHVLNCVGATCPEYFRGELAYRTLWLHDSPGEDITSVLYDAFDYLEDARREGGRVLVHCFRGASRSAAIVTAYLMWRDELPFEDALRAVRKARPTADPNLGFAAQLLQCQRRVLACSSASGTPSSALRAYRMAPHSPYDPLHLVPKSVDHKAAGGFGLLDSRGAFVVHHVPSAIYIWLGHACEPAMAVAATTAANQVVRYERAQGPIITVREGSEPPELLAALSGDDNHSEPKHLRDAIGKRRVELYDLDYETFRRALKGGVVPPVPGIGMEIRLPARETGWSRLRNILLIGGVKELAAIECRRSDDEELLGTSDSIHSTGSFSAESSTTPSPSSNDYASTLSSFSPNSSSSSDWYNLSPPRSELYKKEKGIGSLSPSPKLRTLAERRGSNAPPLILLPPARDEKQQLSATDIVRDWCLSPPFIRDIYDDNEIRDFDRNLMLDPFDEDDAEEDERVLADDSSQLIYPTLFVWPSMDEIEDIHPGVLDSKSVLLLLAPDTKTGIRKSKAKMIYLWVGKQSQVDMAGEKEEQVHMFLNSVEDKFLGRMELKMDIRVQIIKEGQEPEEFLNHLFSFHQITENNHNQST